MTTTPGSPRRYRFAPVTVVAAGGAVAAALLGDAMLYVVMPASPQRWGLSIALVGVLLSANRLVRLVSNPLAAVLFQRLGPRAPFAVAVAVAVVVTASYGWVTAFWLLLLARMTWGVCWSILRMGGQWAVLDEASDADRGYLMGAYSGVVRLGSLGGALAGGLLTDAIGHRPTLALFALVTAAGGLGWFGATRRRAGARPAPDGRPHGGGFGEVLRDRRLLVVSLGGLVTALVFSGLLSASLGFYFRELLGDRVALGFAALGVASLTGIVLGVRSVFDVGLAPLAGALSDRLGRTRTTVAAMLVAAAGVAGLGVAANVWLVLAAALVAFAASVAVTVQLIAAAGDLAPPVRRAAVLGTYATFQDLGAALGPLLGLSWGSLGTLRALFLASALLLVALAFAYRRAMAGEATSAGRAVVPEAAAE